MPRRLVVFLLLAVVLAAGFIRLGFWQLSRLAQRRARNAVVSARLSEPLVPVTTLRSDSASVLRRVNVSGNPDYDHEVVLAARSFQGSPGVYLFTPLRLASSDTAVLVNRGWIYAPDGVSIESRRWRESTTTFVGFAELLPLGETSNPSGVLRRETRVARQLDLATVQSMLPYPISRLYVVATVQDTTRPTGERVARLAPPGLDEGPHLSYALQWFAFAAVALIGGATVAIRSRSL